MALINSVLFANKSLRNGKSTMARRVLVCGGRNFGQSQIEIDFLLNTLDTFDVAYQITEIIHGGARGADRLAVHWANSMEIPVIGFLAEWDKYGRSAGPRRNQRMLDEGKPDLVIAFPGGTGTGDMIGRAKRAGIPVEIIDGP